MAIIYLSVPPNGARWQTVMTNGIGVMMTPKSGMRLERTLAAYCWAADTGCFAQGATFDLDRYFAWLGLMSPALHTCLFATAPDVIWDAQATWRRSAQVLPRLRAMGYPAALVAQDGIEDMDVQWDTFDCLFIGGSTRWKLSETAYDVAAEAKARGKWLHMGRVNSRRRLRAAAVSGFDSADGTHTAFGPDKRLPQLVSWLRELQTQPPMRFE